MKLLFPNGEHGDVIIRPGTISIGGAPGNDVLLESEGIADRHARLIQEAIGLVIRPVDDADVFVNGRRVSDRTPVRAGDVIGVHRVQIRVQPTDASETSQAVPQEHVDAATKVRPAIMNYYLRGVSGDSFGRLFPLSARTVIGRSDDCDLPLKVNEVSRRHAAIEVVADGVRITDLGSANGTFVNGERLNTAEVRELKRNDEIAFDTLRFRLELTTGRGNAPRPSERQPSEPRAAPEPRRGAGVRWALAAAVVVILLVIWWYAGM